MAVSYPISLCIDSHNSFFYHSTIAMVLLMWWHIFKISVNLNKQDDDTMVPSVSSVSSVSTLKNKEIEASCNV